MSESPTVATAGSARGDVDALYFGDVDGDGHAELIVQVMDPEPEDLGMRKGIAWAESPPGTVFVHRTDSALSPSPRAGSSFRIQGYAATRTRRGREHSIAWCT